MRGPCRMFNFEQLMIFMDVIVLTLEDGAL